MRCIESRDTTARDDDARLGSDMSEDGARAATTVIAGVAFAVSAFAASLAALRAVSTTRDPFSSSSSSSVKTEDGGRRAALVLIAHPDDESYFFAPTVQALKRANVETHLVCLSDGGEGGDGETRKKELLRVKEFFGLEGMCVVETDDLRDGMDREWPAKTVMAVLDAYTEGAPATFDYVVTFDAGGCRDTRTTSVRTEARGNGLRNVRAASSRRPMRGNVRKCGCWRRRISRESLAAPWIGSRPTPSV